MSKMKQDFHKSNTTRVKGKICWKDQYTIRTQVEYNTGRRLPTRLSSQRSHQDAQQGENEDCHQQWNQEALPDYRWSPSTPRMSRLLWQGCHSRTPKHHFGPCVPTGVKEAYKLEKLNGNMLWTDAINEKPLCYEINSCVPTSATPDTGYTRTTSYLDVYSQVRSLPHQAL